MIASDWNEKWCSLFTSNICSSFCSSFFVIIIIEILWWYFWMVHLNKFSINHLMFNGQYKILNSKLIHIVWVWGLSDRQQTIGSHWCEERKRTSKWSFVIIIRGKKHWMLLLLTSFLSSLHFRKLILLCSFFVLFLLRLVCLRTMLVFISQQVILFLIKKKQNKINLFVPTGNVNPQHTIYGSIYGSSIIRSFSTSLHHYNL